jgi:hypothetical protein
MTGFSFYNDYISVFYKCVTFNICLRILCNPFRLIGLKRVNKAVTRTINNSWMFEDQRIWHFGSHYTDYIGFVLASDSVINIGAHLSICHYVV